MFIVDFDDTLFDTHRYKQARMQDVAALGVSEEEYWDTYAEARNTPDGMFTYSDARHAEMLALRGYSQDKVLRALQKTSNEDALPSFLFPDAISFLDALHAYDKSMVLLSLGNPLYQEAKTKGSGVSSYFDRLFMVHDTKKHVLSELFEEVHPTEVFFVNDKVQETEALHAAFPHMNAILKVSKNIPLEEYEQSALPHFESLTDIVAYVHAHKK